MTDLGRKTKGRRNDKRRTRKLQRTKRSIKKGDEGRMKGEDA